MRLLVVFAVFVASSTARAEDRTVCFIGRSECRSIVLIQSDWGTRSFVSSRPPDRHSETHVSVEAGAFVNNLWPKQGLGLTVGGTGLGTDNHLHLIVRGQYRYWLGPKTAAEGSLGYIGVGANGVRAQIAIEFADQIALVAGLDVFSTQTYGTFSEGFLAIRLGSITTLPVTLLAAAFSVGNG